MKERPTPAYIAKHALKIRQITAVSVPENCFTQCEAILFALTDDGRLFHTTNRDMGAVWYEVGQPYLTVDERDAIAPLMAELEVPRG